MMGQPFCPPQKWWTYFCDMDPHASSLFFAFVCLLLPLFIVTLASLGEVVPSFL
jgi:hypothetical protein